MKGYWDGMQDLAKAAFGNKVKEDSVAMDMAVRFLHNLRTEIDGFQQVNKNTKVVHCTLPSVEVASLHKVPIKPPGNPHADALHSNLFRSVWRGMGGTEFDNRCRKAFRIKNPALYGMFAEDVIKDVITLRMEPLVYDFQSGTVRMFAAYHAETDTLYVDVDNNSIVYR